MKLTYKLITLMILISVSAQAQWTSSNGNVYNTNSGNVGIGTNTAGLPITSKLVIAQTTDAMSINSSALGFNRSVQDGAIYTPAKSAWQFTARDGMFTLEGYSGASSNPLTVLKSGYIGIGTTIPGEKFEVSGGYVKATGFKDASGNVMVSSQWTTSGSNLIGTNYDVTISGNARIGGKLLTKGFKITLNPATDAFPDYVFSSDFKLRPLEELSEYIAEHKHLPEVPSAKEVESEGMDVKEMNIVLLKKVEELTLYMLQMQKQAEDQQKEINALKNKINKTGSE